MHVVMKGGGLRGEFRTNTSAQEECYPLPNRQGGICHAVELEIIQSEQCIHRALE